MPAQLVSLEEGPDILLDKPIVLIGRHEECDIQLNSRKVSRKHCCVAQVFDYFVVRDLGSTNGVRVNGVRVQEGTMRPGDELTIGNYRYQIQGEAGIPPVQPKPAPNLGDERTASPPSYNGDSFESGDEPIPLADDHHIPAPRALKPADKQRSGPPPIAFANDPALAGQSSVHLPPAPPV
jgi:pSer/pThr/pTyr-binding forkhead associated (FHA) protein